MMDSERDHDDVLLKVEDLAVGFDTPSGLAVAVDGVSFSLRRGETLGIVGESGSGKSVSLMSMLGLIPQPPGRVLSGRAEFSGEDLLALSDKALRRLRGRDIGVVFQDPIASLNPLFRVGNQVSEALRAHRPKPSRSAARTQAVDLLRRVGLSSPDERYEEYPHQFSGGMSQRAMIATAIANNPKLIIADEPTTALDVTIQAQILSLLNAAKKDTGAGVVLVSHDLGVIAEHAERVAVMYAGRIVEYGDVVDVFDTPRHPYTAALLESAPSVHERREPLPYIEGHPPSLGQRPPGCAFHDRCKLGRDRVVCTTEVPELRQAGGTQTSACHYVEELAALHSAAEPAKDTLAW